MNILIITQMYPEPDDEGGNKVTKTVECFANVWADEKNEVFVFHCSSKFPFLLYLIPKYLKDKYAYKTSSIIPSISSRKKIKRIEHGVHVYRIPMFKLLPGLGYSKTRIKKTSRSIIQICKENDFVPDVVAGHFANPSLGLVNYIGSFFNAKTSIVFHGDCNSTTLKKYRVIEYLDGIKAVGARSLQESKTITDLLKLNTEPFLCYSGVPDDVLTTSTFDLTKFDDYDKGLKFLFVGSLIARKHLDAVINAFVAAKNKNDTLSIIGDGPEHERLTKLVSRLDTMHSVSFLGRQTRTFVLNEMKKSHIFTLISDSEVFGMVYIEAMSQGCLVIASKKGGFDGIIIDGFNGFLCEPGNENELISIYRRIEKMSLAERNVIARNAIETSKSFSEKDVANNYLNEIIKRNGNIT